MCAFGEGDVAISLPRRKEMAKERTPGRSLRGLPFRAALHGGPGRKTWMPFMHRLPLSHHARQAEKAKILAVLVGEGLALPVSSQPDARTASRARCAGFYVTSLSFNKEVTKKVNPDEPWGASLSVPRYIAGLGDKHERFLFISRHFATTRGRRRMQKFLLSW